MLTLEGTGRMKKIENLKVRATSVGLATMFAIVGTMTGCSKKNEKKVEVEQNKIGYSTTSQLLTAKDENFAILDVGNYEEQGPILRDTRIKRLNNKDISLGIILSTKANDEGEMYNDIEYVKSLIAKNTIDFPVYLNLTGIIENEKLNPEMKRKLVSIFLNKCTENNIYVGIYGTDEILCKAEEQLKGIIEDYDALVVKGGGDVEYKGAYSLYQTSDGVIHSDKDLSKIIKSKNLNTKMSFLNDKKYTIKENESIIDIAFKYGMSADALLKYNELKMKDISDGITIKIPSRQERVTGTSYKFGTTEEFIRGCDISTHQSHIDWDKLSENFDYIIIRSNFGTKADKKYEENIANAQEYGIPAGVYCYNVYSAKSCNLEEFKQSQQKQAEKTLELLKNKDIVYPVYLDIEQEGQDIPWNKYIPEEYVMSMVDIWCDTMSSVGYVPGLYINGSCYNYLSTVYEKIKNKSQKTANERSFVDNWATAQKWVAGGPKYTSTTYDISEVEAPSDERVESFKDDVNMFQVTSRAKNAGASNDAGYLDVNFSNIDYSKKEPVVTSGNGPEIKEIKDTSNDSIKHIGVATGALATIGASFHLTNKRGYIVNKLKNKVKSKRKKR